MIRQEPTLTIIWVRSPAAQSFRSLSMPIRPPKADASKSLISISDVSSILLKLRITI
jgi:hypothetical protein